MEEWFCGFFHVTYMPSFDCPSRVQDIYTKILWHSQLPCNGNNVLSGLSPEVYCTKCVRKCWTCKFNLNEYWKIKSVPDNTFGASKTIVAVKSVRVQRKEATVRPAREKRSYKVEDWSAAMASTCPGTTTAGHTAFLKIKIAEAVYHKFCKGEWSNFL